MPGPRGRGAPRGAAGWTGHLIDAAPTGARGIVQLLEAVKHHAPVGAVWGAEALPTPCGTQRGGAWM